MDDQQDIPAWTQAIVDAIDRNTAAKDRNTAAIAGAQRPPLGGYHSPPPSRVTTALDGYADLLDKHLAGVRSPGPQAWQKTSTHVPNIGTWVERGYGDDFGPNEEAPDPLDKTHFSVTEQQWKRFNALLDQPHDPPNPPCGMAGDGS